jgi:hypothetical protein
MRNPRQSADGPYKAPLAAKHVTIHNALVRLCNQTTCGVSITHLIPVDFVAIPTTGESGQRWERLVADGRLS